jgi:Zn-dependent protease with chaperone function
MDFFGAQARSRRNTRTLVLLFFLATVAVVACVTFAFHLATGGLGTSSIEDPSAHMRRVFAVAVCTLAFIGLASFYRVASLRSGGGKVAQDLGGTQIHAGSGDRKHRQLYNVVEEMSIASGVPVPQVYVLERETGINAFAAGFSPDDAAIAITRGALEQFDRDQLQGVVAHEFSHVLNGDMRLNLRLMGPLFGILALALAGRMILRGARPVGLSSRRSTGKGAAPVFIMGMVLIVTGYVGLFFARLIKAGVSRQREYLADASAVQFTRQTDGIARALKTIGGYSLGSSLNHNKTEEISHMLFSSGSRLSRWFATHPPLDDRISALDAAFEADSSVRHTRATASDSFVAASASTASGFSDIEIEPDEAVASIGNPEMRHIQRARAIRSGIPASLAQAAHSVSAAPSLLVALVLADESDPQRSAQLDVVTRRHGAELAIRASQLSANIPAVGSDMRLSLVLMACPELRLEPEDSIIWLLETLDMLAAQDARIELFEYTITRVSRTLLERNRNLPRKKRPANAKQTLAACTALLAAIALHGNADREKASAAFHAGLAELDVKSTDAEALPESEIRHGHLDAALDLIMRSGDKIKPALVAALAHTALHDGHVAPGEAELLRAVCIILDCPMPPLVPDNT